MAKKNIRDKRKQDLIFYVVMLAIPMLQFAIFYIGVNFNSFLMSFQKFDEASKEFVFLDFANLFDNFARVFRALTTETVFSYKQPELWVLCLEHADVLTDSFEGDIVEPGEDWE